MKIDKTHLILLAALIGLVVALILTRGCGGRSYNGVETELNFDSIERVIKSQLPPPDTIYQIEEKVITKWLPSSRVVDTIYVEGQTKYIYNSAPIDTAAILTHYLTQAVTYIDTIRDSSLQAVIQDTIFRNSIVSRSFNYKILRPTEIKYIDNRDKFQLIVSAQFGAGATYTNQFNGVYGGLDIGLKFKSGTYFSVGGMAGSGYFATIRAGQVIRLKRKR